MIELLQPGGREPRAFIVQRGGTVDEAAWLFEAAGFPQASGSRRVLFWFDRNVRPLPGDCIVFADGPDAGAWKLADWWTPACAWDRDPSFWAERVSAT